MEDITFSLFKGYADTLPADATLSEIIRMIRQDPTVKLHTLKHRYYASQGNAAAADKEKSSCPAFPLPSVFRVASGRGISAGGLPSDWWTSTTWKRLPCRNC